MKDIYLKSNTEFQLHTASTAEEPQESLNANEPYASYKKRCHSLLFEVPQQPFASFSLDSFKMVEIVGESPKECETPFSTETSWMDDFLIGELHTACHPIDPRQNSLRMGCPPGLFYPPILSPNDLRPGLFQDMYNRAMH